MTLDSAVPEIAGPGVYTAALRLPDDTPYGVISLPVTLTLVVSPCVPLTATALAWAPPVPVLGQPVAFTGTAGGSWPLTWTWAFGDGGAGSGPHPTHTYATGGDYSVAMTATNPCGRQAVQRTIFVTGWSIYLPLLFKG